MANTLTITAKTGPAVQATSLVISNVSTIKYDLVREVVTVVDTSDLIREFSLTGSNTITMTASGGAYTISIS